MSKVRRLNKWIVELLEDEGEMTSSEIYEFVNRMYYHGATRNQLSNVLAKSKDIERHGFIEHHLNGFRHREVIWKLRDSKL
jgi:hypothetical protein